MKPHLLSTENIIAIIAVLVSIAIPVTVFLTKRANSNPYLLKKLEEVNFKSTPNSVKYYLLDAEITLVFSFLNKTTIYGYEPEIKMFGIKPFEIYSNTLDYLDVLIPNKKVTVTIILKTSAINYTIIDKDGNSEFIHRLLKQAKFVLEYSNDRHQRTYLEYSIFNNNVVLHNKYPKISNKYYTELQRKYTSDEIKMFDIDSNTWLQDISSNIYHNIMYGRFFKKRKILSRQKDRVKLWETNNQE